MKEEQTADAYVQHVFSVAEKMHNAILSNQAYLDHIEGEIRKQVKDPEARTKFFYQTVAEEAWRHANAFVGVSKNLKELGLWKP